MSPNDWVHQQDPSSLKQSTEPKKINYELQVSISLEPCEIQWEKIPSDAYRDNNVTDELILDIFR